MIGTKWVFKIKLNEDGQVTRNKERLVCKGYAQVEGIYFAEKNSPISRIEAIRMLLAYVLVTGEDLGSDCASHQQKPL